MRIALLGDIALFGRCADPKYFEIISKYLEGFDYVVGNLETPFSIQKKTNGAKSAYICSDISGVHILKMLHLKAVTLANNHMFDYGKEGYELTKELLDKEGIEWFGTEGKELKIEKFGNKLAFSGYCCFSSNPLNCVRDGGYGVNAYDLNKTKEILDENNKNGYLNILAVHAGIEHVNYPSLDHIRAARQLADVCPFVYYGHHPHVIQGVEVYKGSLIAHSLGNFCFDDVYTDATSNNPLVEMTENNRTGMLLELTIEGNKLISWKEQVIYIPKKGAINLNDKDENLAEYNKKLVLCEEDSNGYDISRRRVIDERISERKAKRDIVWFTKRLRYRYIRLIIDMRRNNKLYNDCVKSYL